MNRRDRRIAAKRSKGAPGKIPVITSFSLYEAALCHFHAAQYADAQICCQKALVLDAGYADALHLMGRLSLQARQYDAAIEWVGRANLADPTADHLGHLGIALEQQGLHEQALSAFDKAVQLKPYNAQLWTCLANVLVLLQRPDHAILSFEHALKLDPRCWEAAYHYGVFLLRSNRFEEALIKFNICDELRPHHAPTLNRRGQVLFSLNRCEEALSDNQLAWELDPTNFDACNDIGAILGKVHRLEESIGWFDKALELRPDALMVLLNKAFALSGIHKFDEAITILRRVKYLAPENAETDWNMSHIQLLTGDFKAGWQSREARWQMRSLPGTVHYPIFAKPMWDGKENIQGKTIIVCADEGLGDTIQFVRYVPMLKELGARVILLSQDSLCPLLSTMPSVSECLPTQAQVLPEFDFHCPIMSLPLAFQTTLENIPAPTSYLPAPRQDLRRVWEDRLGPHNKLRVGLVWSGNPKHVNDHNRSIPLRAFSSILNVDATFISLQRDLRSTDKAVLLEETDILNVESHLTDFMETATLISCLDLVITVDTSVAHLAGALGCPTWMLISYTPDWRWLLNREDSPWYPAIRLFRQTPTQEYSSVLLRVRTELLLLADAKRTADSPRISDNLDLL